MLLNFVSNVCQAAWIVLRDLWRVFVTFFLVISCRVGWFDFRHVAFALQPGDLFSQAMRTKLTAD